MLDREHPSGTESQSGTYVLVRLFVLTVILLAAWPPALTQGRADPWIFETVAASDAARSDYSNAKADIQYDKAETALEKGRLDEAIARLRLAIHQENQSGEIATVQKTDILYFPYWKLGLAFEGKNEMGKALLCLEEELAQGEIANYKKNKKLFDEDLNRVRTQRDLQPTMDMAEQVIAWGTSGSRVLLSPAGQDPHQVVKSEFERVKGSQGRSPADVASLLSKIKDLCVVELNSGREKLRLYRMEDDWQGAFTGAEERYASLVSADQCTLPGQGSDLDSVQAAKDEVEACNTTILDAMRQAARWKCRQIGEQITVLNSLGVLKQRPDECDAINQANRTNMERRNPSLAKLSRDYENEGGAMRAGMEAEALQWDTDKAAALERIPTLPAGCDKALGEFASVSRTLTSIRTRLEGANRRADYEEHDSEISSALDSLRNAAGEGVKRLDNAYASCTKSNTGLPELDGALVAYRQTAVPRNLTNLCKEASSAQSAVGDCWKRSAGDLEIRAESLVSRLGQADAWMKPLANLPSMQDEKLACVSRLHMRMSRTRRRNTQSWIDQTVEDSESADVCLAEFEKAREETFRALDERVTAMEKSLGSGAEATATLAEDAQEARLLHEKFKNLGDENLADASTSQVFLDAAEKLPRLEQVSAKLGPYLSLSEALTTFHAGKLDDAIRSLRRDLGSGGRIPSSGTPAAAGHAVLSYFLWIKHKAALNGDAQVAGLYGSDAKTEVLNSIRADADFVLPSMLENNEQFRRFFDETREGRS